MSKETAGKLIYDHWLSDNTVNDHSIGEQTREQLKKYEENVLDVVKKGKKETNGDFYVLCLSKREKVLDRTFVDENGIAQKVITVRQYFFYRLSCPTPEWDQTVYSYKRKDDHLKFLWVIPAKDICEYYKFHALEVVPAERELLQFVLEFSDGTLFRLAKKLNGEVDDSPLLLEKKGLIYV